MWPRIFRFSLVSLFIAIAPALANDELAVDQNDELAADQNDELAADQKMSFRKLVFQRGVNSTLSSDAYSTFRQGFDWFGMDEHEGRSWDPLESGPDIQAWCQRATENMQEQLGQVDDRDEALMTMDAAEERCAQAYDYGLNIVYGMINDDGAFVPGSCKSVALEDGTPGYSCTVRATVKIRHFDVQLGASNGTVSAQYSLDDDWLNRKKVKGAESKGEGHIVFQATQSGTAYVTKFRGAQETRAIALNSAANKAGRFLYRKVLNIKEFRQRAPLSFVRAGRTGMCLGSDQQYKDMPFVVFAETEKGEKRRGFIKIRKVLDGCVETTELRERAENGEKINIGPTEAQIILGRGRIQPAMTAERLPDMGLNIGLAGGLGAFDGTIFGTSFSLLSEQSLARLTNIRGLHSVVRFGVVVTVAEPDLSGIPFINPLILLTGDLGIRRRAYIGPAFLSIGVSFSYARLETEYVNMNMYGGRAEFAMGAQLSPRVLIHVPVAFIGQVGKMKDFSGADMGYVMRLAPEVLLEALYTF